MATLVIEAEISGHVQRLGEVDCCYSSPQRLALQEVERVLNDKPLRCGNAIVGRLTLRLEQRLPDGRVLVYTIGSHQPKERKGLDEAQPCEVG